MSSRILHALAFEPQGSHAKNGIALIFDLEGFSKFFNQPDVQDYVPRYINHVMNAVSMCFLGGKLYWINKERAPLLAPVHEKFLGDGALYLWTPRAGEKTFSDTFIVSLANRLWNLKTFFSSVNRKCADDVPVAELPERIRFGLARGTIYELKRRNSTKKEYIGFCINLATRLQKYCPDLGFIGSARIGLSESILKKNGYIKVVASKIRGFPKEVVIVDQSEFEDLDEESKEDLFEVI